MLLSLFIGRYPRPIWMPPGLLWEDELARRLFFNLRLPRVLAAFLTGASLAGAGLVLQMVFRNPLVSPGFLGVSQGAGFGAALGILFLGRGALTVEITAIIMAFAGLGISYFLAARIRFGDWALRLVLAGIAVSAFFSAGLGLMQYIADPLSELPDIVFWLLGDLSGVTWPEFLRVLPLALGGLVVMLLMRWRLNVLSLRDDTAFSLGASLLRERLILLAAAVAATAAMVAVAGVVGWVGLIAPHLARRLVGANAQYAMPAACLIGGIYALLGDNVARTLLPGEIPLGILTSLIGAALFVLLLTGNRLGMRK
ncbi:MAG: iron ABC transporter permease [Caldilineaceae bacterium]|nr:iron ABC transporter permease [Caldilineaceae bacterium]MCB9137726.1 iron ABC transporter permease [Caldilineaceae bacterium]